MDKKRLQDLVIELINYLDECVSSSDILDVLYHAIGLKESELRELGFDYLFEDEEE